MLFFIARYAITLVVSQPVGRMFVYWSVLPDVSSVIAFLIYLFSPVDEFRKLHISASDGNWPSAHPQVAICFSAWHEFKQVFETNKIKTI